MVIVSVHAVVAIIRELSEISSSNNPSEASLTSAVAASSTGKEDANLNLLLQQQARVDGGQPQARIMGIPTEVEDAILQLSGVVTFDQLEESVRDALELTLPNVSDVVVYVLNPDTQELVSSHSLVHTLPREGLPLNAIQKRERVLVSELDPSDPISGLITFSPNGATTSRKVLCSPVVDKETDKVIAVFVVVCNNLSKEDHEHLNFLERQFLVCYRRLKLTGAASSKISSIVGVSAGKERRNSASPILKLCAELCDQDAASLQVKVLRYLLQQTQSQSGFLLLVDLDHRELFCQVIGQSILKEELRFPIEKSNFNSALKSKKTMLLADLSASHRQELERELDVRLESLLCVPVINTATDAVTALACLLNKAEGENYDEADIETVQHCFKYTSTVLHSTVAVQNERTLKNQTQALLQVARNLFTHLGEFLFSATTDFDKIDQGRLRAMGRTDDWPGMASDSCPFVFLNNRAKDHDKLSLTVDFIRTCFRDFPNVTDLRKTVAQQHPQSNRPDKVRPRDAALMDGAKKEVVAKEGLADSRKLADGTGNPIERFSGAAKKNMPVKDGLTDDRVRADLSSCEVLGKGQHEMDELSRKTSGKGSIEAVSCSENDVTQIATGIAQIAIDKKDVSEVALNVQDLHRFGSSLTAESSTSGGALSTASSGTKELLNTAFMNISSHSLESKSSSIKGTGCTKYPAQAPKALWRSETFDDLTRLLREIMQEARTLTKAERCSVFLLEKENNELVAKVFDGDVQEGKEQIIQSEVRIPADQGIAGHVATTGELLNIDDAYSHPLFYRGVDETTGFRTRNILCFPIKEKNDEVIGVAQLCNKINGAGFSSFDEDIAQAFSVFCCMSIVHSLMYKSVRDSQHRSKLSNELITYHMQVPHEEVQMLSIKEFPSPQEINIHFDKFFFIPRNLPYDKTSVAVISMFEDMGFISKYRINKETLAKFVLMVRKGYRDPPYHNWAHAFAVAHFCYLINKNTNLGEYLDDLEIFALFVACLCHDIDHRGTTNSYQVASDSVLAALYSSEGSVMERHHFAQTMCIINLEGCNIFDNLSKSEYEKVLDMMRDIILATDLAHHLRILKDLQTMADVGINRDKKSQRMLLLCLIMTCCDLSDQTKTWTNSKQIAELIYMEFFSQGDLERALGHSPSEMMDREKACIPQLQLGFLDGIALPVFRILTQIFPDASVVVKAVENNRRMWTKVVKILSELGLPTNMEVFKLPQLEEDFLNTNDS